MKTWADFYDYVLPYLPGITGDMASLHIRNATIEFCDETGVADFEATPIPLVKDQAQYSVVQDGASYNVARIKSAYVGEYPLTATTADVLDESNLNWKSHKGQPVKYLQPSPNTVLVYPIPDEAVGSLQLTYTLRPNRTSMGIEDFIFERYVEAIASGAIYRSASMPNKPWTNDKLALENRIMFRNAINDATVEVNKSFTRAKLQVKFKRIV